MEIFNEKVEDQVVIRIKGSLDYIAAPSLRSYIKDVVASGDHKIRLNMESMDYISSAGFGVLLHAKKEVEKHNGTLEIDTLNQHVREVFRMAGLLKVFNLED